MKIVDAYAYSKAFTKKNYLSVCFNNLKKLSRIYYRAFQDSIGFIKLIWTYLESTEQYQSSSEHTRDAPSPLSGRP